MMVWLGVVTVLVFVTWLLALRDWWLIACVIKNEGVGAYLHPSPSTKKLLWRYVFKIGLIAVWVGMGFLGMWLGFGVVP